MTDEQLREGLERALCPASHGTFDFDAVVTYVQSLLATEREKARQEEREACAEVAHDTFRRIGAREGESGFRNEYGHEIRHAILARIAPPVPRWCKHTEYEHERWFFRQYPDMCAEPVKDNCNACPICGAPRPSTATVCRFDGGCCAASCTSVS